jgi:hypothetical protein
MTEPTLEEVRAAAASGAGDMVTVRHANAYLRLRFTRACDERDEAHGTLRQIMRLLRGAGEVSAERLDEAWGLAHAIVGDRRGS